MGIRMEKDLRDRLKARAKAEEVSLDILVQREMANYLMRGEKNESVIAELFDCGHGHYSTHEHTECQLCHQGKPEARYNVEVIEGKNTLKLYWKSGPPSPPTEQKSP